MPVTEGEDSSYSQGIRRPAVFLLAQHRLAPARKLYGIVNPNDSNKRQKQTQDSGRPGSLRRLLGPTNPQETQGRPAARPPGTGRGEMGLTQSPARSLELPGHSLGGSIRERGGGAPPGAGRTLLRPAISPSRAALGDWRSDWSVRKARGAKLASHHPLQPVCGRAHVRAPGARACASPPFVRPPRRRALRSRQGPRARPPAVHPLRDAAHGPPVRSGAGGEVRRRAATPWKPRRPPRRVRPLLPARGPLPQSRGGVGPRGLGWEALRHLAGGWGRFV